MNQNTTAILLSPPNKCHLTIAAANYSELELINALRNRNKDAFSYLYDNYSPALFGIICRYIKNKTASEDVLQEVFVKIWNNFSYYDESRGRLYTWMLSITKNLMLDIIRSKGYKQQLKTLTTQIDIKTNCDCEFSKFDSLRICSFLKMLSRDEVNLIDLAYYHGMTQAEIAKNMAMPIGTVKTKLRNAIIKLRHVIISDR